MLEVQKLKEKQVMKHDFELLLTRKVWEDYIFAEQVQKDPDTALKSLGIKIPTGVKLKVIIQKRDTIYFTIPPFQEGSASYDKEILLNQIDLWSSANLFIWLASVSLKTALLQMRNSIFSKKDKKLS